MSDEIDTVIETEEIGSIVKATNSSLAANLAVSELNASLGTGWNSKKNWEFELTDAQREVLYDVEAESIEAWFEQYDRKKEDNRYFLIREALRAKHVNMKIEKDRLASLGGEATIKVVVDSSGKWEYNAKSEYQLQGKFSEPRTICIKPEEFILATKSTAGGAASVSLQEVSEPLEINQIAR